jgi:hypothetical protein
LAVNIPKLDLTSKIILITAIAVRAILSYFNLEFNDDHITPILLWVENGHYPEALDCWECFQPPLYYSLILLIGKLFDAVSFNDYLTIVRAVNFVFSGLIAVIIARRINRIVDHKLLKYAVMAFWLFNPELISIGALNTNDIALILVGLIVYPFITRYWQNISIIDEVVIWSLLVLASLLKGNGLVFVIIFIAVIGIKFLDRKYKLKDIIRLFIFFSVSVCLIGVGGKYYHKYKVFNNPFIINQNPAPTPNIFQADSAFQGRKGVTTISESFFTFRLFSLLEEPFNRNGSKDYQVHRTSFFTQLYGQFSNYFFESHPGSWRSNNNDMKNFVRVNYILHLPLLAMFVYLIVIRIRKLWPFKKADVSSYFDMLVLGIFMMFLIRYSIIYRDFSNMKIVFVFPMLIGLINLFYESIKSKRYTKPMAYLLLLCALLYNINYVYLILRLS